MDDILRGSDDSDTEDVVAPVVQSLAPRNENENGVVDTPSSVKSESLLATQSSDGGWDISPDANQSRDPIENSIAERTSFSCLIVPVFIYCTLTLLLS